MKKKLIIIYIVCLFFLVGCDNKEEIVKNNYMEMRNKLLEKDNYTNAEDLPLDIIVDIIREEEIIKYKIDLKNPKENMKDIVAIVVHNYYNENLFPTIGIFDEKQKLLTTEKNKVLELEDTIDTTKDISKINLEIKIWIKYKNDLNEEKEVIYKTT